MRWLIAMVLILFISIAQVSASCSGDQVNINSASLEELDTLAGIGPVYAQRIIDSRPYESLGGLLDVNGIGNKTLEKIKTQGLACVDSDSNEDEENNGEESEDKEHEAEKAGTVKEETETIVKPKKPVTS